VRFLSLAPNKQVKKQTFLITLIGQRRLLLHQLSSNLLRASLLEAEVGKHMAVYCLSPIAVTSYNEVSLQLGLSFSPMLSCMQLAWSQPWEWCFQPRWWS